MSAPRGAPRDDLCIGCATQPLPAAMTPAIGQVLGMPNFRAAPAAHLYRASGLAVRPRCEDEQAFVLWRYLPIAVRHGSTWWDVAGADLEAHVARARALGAEASRQPPYDPPRRPT